MDQSLSGGKKMSNCPHCTKPVMNQGEFIGPAQFRIRCPWCQKNLMISVETKISIMQVMPTMAEQAESAMHEQERVTVSFKHDKHKQKIIPEFGVAIGNAMKHMASLYSEPDVGPPKNI